MITAPSGQSILVNAPPTSSAPAKRGDDGQHVEGEEAGVLVGEADPGGDPVRAVHQLELVELVADRDRGQVQPGEDRQVDPHLGREGDPAAQAADQVAPGADRQGRQQQAVGPGLEPAQERQLEEVEADVAAEDRIDLRRPPGCRAPGCATAGSSPSGWPPSRPRRGRSGPPVRSGSSARSGRNRAGRRRSGRSPRPVEGPSGCRPGGSVGDSPKARPAAPGHPGPRRRGARTSRRTDSADRDPAAAGAGRPARR